MPVESVQDLHLAVRLLPLPIDESLVTDDAIADVAVLLLVDLVAVLVTDGHCVRFSDVLTHLSLHGRPYRADRGLRSGAQAGGLGIALLHPALDRASLAVNEVGAGHPVVDAALLLDRVDGFRRAPFRRRRTGGGGGGTPGRRRCQQRRRQRQAGRDGENRELTRPCLFEARVIRGRS